MGRPVKDLAGSRFGRLVALELAGRTNAGRAVWQCSCDCGNTAFVGGSNLQNNTRSCGCLAREKSSETGKKYGGQTKTLHGHAKGTSQESPTYKSWASMKMRCRNEAYGAYQNYGAKGITYCERWESFENFLADMGVRPKGTTIDRIDGTKGYYPENCRWATTKEQNENRRSSVWIEYAGERMLMSDFARKLGMRVDTVWYRLNKRGMSPEQIASTPIDVKKSQAGASKCLSV